MELKALTPTNFEVTSEIEFEAALGAVFSQINNYMMLRGNVSYFQQLQGQKAVYPGTGFGSHDAAINI